MANNMLTDMEFEQRLVEMGDNQPALIRFIARNQYQMSKLCPIHAKKIKSLENKTTKELGIFGGLGALLGATVAGAIDYFLRR